MRCFNRKNIKDTQLATKKYTITFKNYKECFEIMN